MKPFAVVLILTIVLALSFYEGESVKGLKVCKQDNPSKPNGRCKQPKCDDDCALKHPLKKAWGNCKFDNDERFVCECSFLCHHHGGHHDSPTPAPSIHHNPAPSPTPTYYYI